MYIKRIIINGFKSYKNQNVVEDFDPGHNVIVGRNGSGKSNFFSAIRFVLNDAYAKLNQEERLGLFHEGMGDSSGSAFVEIIFDNNDFRFPIRKTEVCLRRLITSDKDEYYLDGKSITKTEMMNLLQSAGFSKSNPYYIVPQGRLTLLVNSKESDYFQLIKEVAGTLVYENYLSESLKLLEETTDKREKIQELLSTIEEKVNNVNKDKIQYIEYQNLDKTKRCCEYNIFQREYNNILASLSSLEEHADKDKEELRSKHFERCNLITECERDISRLEQDIELLDVELSYILEQKQANLQEKFKLELFVKDSLKENEKCTITSDALLLNIRSIDADIKQKEEHIENLMSEINNMDISYYEKKKQDLSRRITSFLDKKRLFERFQGQKEKDDYLAHEIAKTKDNLKHEENKIEDMKERSKDSQMQIKNLKSRLFENEEKLRLIDEAIENNNSEISKKGDEKEELVEKRKSIWREESKILTLLPKHREELDRQKRSLYSTLDKHISMGLNNIQDICNRYDIGGVHGTVHELFSVEETFNTCVEVVAGQSLFHVVVEDCITASRIIEVMNREKKGRVTFIPLNRVKSRNIDFPKSRDFIPILNIIKYNAKYENLFRQIFSKVVIVPSLEKGSAIVKEYGFDVITLDGDRIDRKGAITGGYVDHQASRINMLKNINFLQKKVCELEKNECGEEKRLQEYDQEITKMNGLIHMMKCRNRQLHCDKNNLVTECSDDRKRLEILDRDDSNWLLQIEETNSRIFRLETRLAEFSNYLGKPIKAMSNSENEELRRCEAEMEECNNTIVNILNKKTCLEIEMNDVRNDVDSYLKKHKQQIHEFLRDLEDGKQVSDPRNMLRSINTALDELESSEKFVVEQKSNIDNSIREIKKTLEEYRNMNESEKEVIHKQDVERTRMVSQRIRLIQKKEECSKRLQEFGIVPEEALSVYSKKDTNELINTLKSVNESLRGYYGINKNAIDHCDEFSRQRDDLVKRREELHASLEHIEEFIQSLDYKKEEAVEKTFSQISGYFSEIFQILVPQGSASINMVRDNSNSAIGGFSYTGISIKVSFDSSSGDCMRIHQLSGGQKSVVALTLIFSIQRCDPAPFYLFDEIDSNLDISYRRAVSHLISSLKSNAQIITTTFRPELLESGDKFYGISFSNRVSNIECITKDIAKDFVEKEDKK